MAKSYRRFALLLAEMQLRDQRRLAREATHALQEYGIGLAKAYLTYGDAGMDSVGFLLPQIPGANYRDATSLLLRGAVGLGDPRAADLIREQGVYETQRILDLTAKLRGEGKGPVAIAEALKIEIPRGKFRDSRTRAKVIARTETKLGQNASSLEAYEAMGINRVEAVDGQLATSDEECKARNGEVWPILEAKRFKDHPNGTLSWTPVVDVEPIPITEEDLMRVRARVEETYGKRIANEIAGLRPD